MDAQRKVGRPVGQAGQGARHLVQPPNAPQVAQRRPKRDPPLGPPQRRPQGVGGQVLEPGGFLRHHIGIGGRGIGQPVRQPVGLALDQPGQIGAATGGAPDQIGQHRIGDAGAVDRGLAARGVDGNRQAGDARCKGHGATLAGGGARSMPGGPRRNPRRMARVSIAATIPQIVAFHQKLAVSPLGAGGNCC